MRKTVECNARRWRQVDAICQSQSPVLRSIATKLLRKNEEKSDVELVCDDWVITSDTPAEKWVIAASLISDYLRTEQNLESNLISISHCSMLNV